MTTPGFVSRTDAAVCLEIAISLLARDISNPNIRRTVSGIREYIQTRACCTVKQWDAIQNIKASMDKYDMKYCNLHKPQSKPNEPEGARSRASHAWDPPDDDYFSEEMYGHNA